LWTASVVNSCAHALYITVQCIGEAFGIDPSNEDQRQRLSIKPATLQSIFDVFIKTREKMGSTSSTTSSFAAEQSTSSSTTAKSTGTAPTDVQKAEAEKLKAQGNAKMSSKDYDAAIELYTEAIAGDSTNAVYYSNRAAAYSSKGDHMNAVKDAEKALEVDPTFVRAYHRLG
jgi:small glutamine-rich tetratricopeptide repeat-containing protein alpha